MRSRSWHRNLLHSTIVLLIGVVAAAVHVLIENNLLPLSVRIVLARAGLSLSVLHTIATAYLWLFSFCGLIASIVFLCRASFLVALSYLALTATVFASTHVSVVLKGSRFSFPELAHDEIAEI